MKIILLAICSVAVLVSTGCVFRGGHGHANDQEHQQIRDADAQSRVVDHGEFPGDRGHDPNR
jgi:hypothetical protein